MGFPSSFYLLTAGKGLLAVSESKFYQNMLTKSQKESNNIGFKLTSSQGLLTKFKTELQCRKKENKPRNISDNSDQRLTSGNSLHSSQAVKHTHCSLWHPQLPTASLVHRKLQFPSPVLLLLQLLTAERCVRTARLRVSNRFVYLSRYKCLHCHWKYPSSSYPNSKVTNGSHSHTLQYHKYRFFWKPH